MAIDLGPRQPTSRIYLLAAPVLWGSAGAVIAAVIACWAFPVTTHSAPLSKELLPSHWIQFHPEPREFHFLALAAVLGTAGALLGAAIDRPRPPLWPAAAGGLVLALALDSLLRFALSDPGAAPIVSALALTWIVLLGWMARYTHPFTPPVPPIPKTRDVQTAPGRIAWKEHVVPIIALILVLTPSSLEAVAAQIGYEMHVVSFIIGPALYAKLPGLVPGIDYFSQYSVGLPYLFSYLVGRSADGAVLNYVALIVATMLAYYAGAYYFMRWLFGSWRWALAVALTALLLQFHTDRIFFDPSSYVLRHPLLILMIAVLAWWVTGGLRWARGAALVGVIAVSLFLNTETGIYQLLIAMAVAFFAARSSRRGLATSAAVGAISLFVFAGLCFLAFGRGVLSVDFVRYYVEPLFIYGAGFGGWQVDWSYGWPVYYNVIAPGLAVATIGWGFIQLKRHAIGADRSRIAALSSLACAGVALTAKYWNMSLIALWHVNALPFLALTAWWSREALATLGPRHVMERTHFPLLRKAGIGVLASAAFTLLAFAGDPRNPNYYGLRAYLKYPSAWSAPFRHRGCRALECSAPRLSAEDVQLIDSLTRPTERVAVLDWNDWAYLIDAERAPKSIFLPSFATFTHRQLDDTVAGLDLVFVTTNADGSYVISPPELDERLGRTLRQKFQVVGRGARLTALRRLRP